MSRSYRFTLKRTDTSVPLAEVEGAMLTILGVPPNKEKFHPVYDTFILAAFGRLMVMGGYTLLPHMWSHIIAIMSEGYPPPQGIKVKAALLFLESEYDFHAWG